MPQILAEIGLEAIDHPHHSPLAKAFDRLKMKIWRMQLHRAAQLHDTTDHAAMDTTCFDPQ
jgi:IS5 family transposase